ncbi:3-oxoacyl-[acyl-carrier-protein] reductase [Actinoplanes sandaracinus]|uniref:3-oxoacyl-[acyl-carrier-protein] reductase n=1 Tax=Actinoplanes sandaracinus TaxID=3045177 RepID=UPI0038991C91
MEKRTVLVTGGSRGIGRAVAVQLAADGYDVAFCYRTGGEAAAITADEIKQHGVRVHHAPCDVADPAAVDAFVRGAEEELGPIDVLVNSAGIVRDAPMVLMEYEAWDSVLQTNLTGTYNFCHAVTFGFMKRHAGTIVNVSSVAGVYGNATQANYAATKGGINALSRSLAKELGPYGIRVNAVAPGFIETDMTAELPEKARKKAIGMIPLRRLGQVADVANLVSYLASDRAAYLTGQVLQVDGGIVL